METKLHRDCVNSYLQTGFVNEEFSKFIKLAILKCYVDEIDLISAYEKVLNSKRGIAYRVQKYKSMLPNDIELEDDFYEYVKGGVDEYLSHLNKYTTIRPDAWAFIGNDILVYEIEHNHSLGKDRLKKYAIVKDILWQHHSYVNLRVIEVDARKLHEYEHDLNVAFDVLVDAMPMPHISNDNEHVDHYFIKAREY